MLVVALNQCAVCKSLQQNNACLSPESVCSMQVAVAKQCMSQRWIRSAVCQCLLSPCGKIMLVVALNQYAVCKYLWQNNACRFSAGTAGPRTETGYEIASYQLTQKFVTKKLTPLRYRVLPPRKLLTPEPVLTSMLPPLCYRVLQSRKKQSPTLTDTSALSSATASEEATASNQRADWQIPVQTTCQYLKNVSSRFTR